LTGSSHLDWPFLEPRHKALAIDLDRWAGRVLSEELHDHSVHAVDDACRTLVRQLGEGGWLKYAIGGTAYGAPPMRLIPAPSPRSARRWSDIPAWPILLLPQDWLENFHFRSPEQKERPSMRGQRHCDRRICDL
jgi:hypothetical protein